MAENELTTIEFVPDEPRGASSGELVAGNAPANALSVKSLARGADEPQMSAAFNELASIELPQLDRRTRARLQMQTPNRVYFYWSVAQNPFRKLTRALGMETAGYSLVLKLVNLDRDTDEMHRIEEEGSRWFDVDADQRYRAEIGFYSPSRPFVRILFSNTVATPRKSPSSRTADAAHWKVTSDRFAKILDVSGFSQDAFHVALAGDEPESADDLSRRALAQLTGEDVSYADIEAQEIRLALLLLASGAALDDLRLRLSSKLLAIVTSNIGKLGPDDAYRVMSEHFEIDRHDFDVEESDATVYGASLVNFPRRLRTRPRVPGGYAPMSSFTVSAKQ
jgi:hypothetical protein